MRILSFWFCAPKVSIAFMNSLLLFAGDSTLPSQHEYQIALPQSLLFPPDSAHANSREGSRPKQRFAPREIQRKDANEKEYQEYKDETDNIRMPADNI